MPIPAGALLGPYEILSPLGAGGMGEVYRARDPRLARDVAVKLLPGDFLEGEESRLRFEREAQLLAALSHPNIAAVFSFEEIPGPSPSSPSRHILVMELLEGATLREKLDSGPVPPKQAVDYALQIAKGLSAAHEKGIVHRDLKPENLIVSRDGHLKILDFGLAKRAEQGKTDETSAPTASKYTEPGVVMGTVGYMSPEQVRGLPVDHRSDIFSFGAILYELLSGKRAFKRDTPADTMSAILKEEPPELSESGRNVPPSLDRVVRHCLEKDRSDRFQSAKDIAFALSEASGPATMMSGAHLPPAATRRSRAVLAVAVLALLTFSGILLFRFLKKPSTVPPGPKRIAVLPFENLGAPENGYFADGMTDDVRSKLAALSGLAVIASGSSAQYKATTKSPEQIAKELGVGYLLVAKVRWQKAGQSSRIRVSPELVDLSGGGAPTTRWQEAFDADLTDVFRVQGEIAAKVAKSLDLVLSGRESGNLAARATSNLSAWEAYLKGNEIANEGGSFRSALPWFEKAVALDPGFAAAWAAISKCHAYTYAWEPTAAGAKAAKDAVDRAMQIAPDQEDSAMALASYLALVVKDQSKSEEIYARLLREHPNDVGLLLHQADAVAEASVERSLELLRKVDDLDPRGSADRPRIKLAATLLMLRRAGEARAVCDRGLAISPKAVMLVHLKALTYVQAGDLAGARRVIAEASKEIEPTRLVHNFAHTQDHDWLLDDAGRELLLRLTPGAFQDIRGEWAIALAQAASRSGDQARVREYAEEARKAYATCAEAGPDPSYCPMYLGLSLAYLGRKEEAVREGEKAVALMPIAKNKSDGPFNQHNLVRIHILCGNYETAIDLLEPLLNVPYVLTPAWLRIDPNFDPLRKNPRFQKLVAGK